MPIDFKDNFIILDGAMGTMLQSRGLKTGELPELLNITNPDEIEAIHREYIEAGADIIYANTFGANGYKLADSGHSVSEVVAAGIRCAKNAAKGTKALVALDMGTLGQLLEPTGTLPFESAYEYYKEAVLAAREADLIVFETQTDLYELKAAVLAAKENSDKPIIATMTFEQNKRTFTGCTVSSMALTLEGLGVDALGVNCSLGPKELLPIVTELAHWTTLPLIVKANAGLPDPVTNEYTITPDEFALYAEKLVDAGATILGGCCGTNPEYIAALSKMLKKKTPIKRSSIIPSAVCSAGVTVTVDKPCIIGERINPTGKKLFKEALSRGDIDYILGQGIEQVRAGADILDVNVGLPGTDEKAMMVKTVKALQSVTETPLQLDSTIPEVLEAALRIYNGKPIVNSVNGDDESLDAILPLCKKYGAAVVGLTLDKGGIPQIAHGRFTIAKKILDRARRYGIPDRDVYIDCLTMTVSAEQKLANETLSALTMVKSQLGLKTVLGVSNISFGLPNRELINSGFLMMALTSGLDLAIINPNIASMTGAVRSYKLLRNIDKNATEFISAYGGEQNAVKAEKKENIDIFYAVENGLKAEASRITAELLMTTPAMDIVNEMLIPALDKVGERFEKGQIFLPQLILSAGTAQVAFDEIKKKLSEDNAAPVSKGKIVLATVKGDIHDIGKNIVKILLENYGYTVIDLGKDVECQAVVDAAIEHKADIVGLSALMTTTLSSMEKTVQLLHDNKVKCKIMVGGAVLTPEYAEKIGADFYGKDAKASVNFAKQIIG